MSFTAVGVLTFLLASVCVAEDNNDITSCSDNPCQNGGECEDVQDDYVCYCLLGYIGDNCQFQGGVVNTTVCLTSSQSLDNDSSCAKAVDGSDANGLGTEWVIAGTNGAIGAYIVLHLVDKYNVIGIKYLQRCEPQMQFKKLIITLNDGTVKMVNTTCSGSTSDDCDNDRWETLMYDSAKSNIYLIKITILEVCSGQIQTNVGLRDVEILTTVDIDDCQPNPCQHGSCTDGVNAYTCTCDAGYEGTNCETDIDDCNGVVCDNGGSCVDEVDGFICLCVDGTEGVICTDPEDLDCDCTLNGTSLQVKVFDEPDLKLYSSGQKTVLSAYKNDQHDSCKFKFQAVSLGSTAPAQLSAMTFNIGKHTKNRNKFYRSYKMFGPRVLERGVNKKEKQVTLPYCWTSPDQQTDICIERVGDVIQFRSTTCPYALDVDVGTTPMTGTLFVEKSYSDQLTGMCGNCDNQDNGYHLADGTSVDDEEDMQERYRLITESYLDTKARSRRSRN